MEMVPPVNRRWITEASPGGRPRPLSAQYTPSVYVHDLARHVPREIAAQEKDGAGDVLRRWDPAQRDGRLDPRAAVTLERRYTHLGVHPARRHAVDQDVRGVLDGQRLGQRDDGPLAGRIVAVERLTPLAGRARHEHDPPSGAHQRDGRLCREKERVEIGRHGMAPALWP